MQILQDRVAAIERVLADPPQVHPPASGVWSTDPACYKYMATLAKPGSRTLETGLGVSTALFALWGCQHTCVVHSESEVIACQDYFKAHEISEEGVNFQIGPSEQVLPNLILQDLDLVFIDGCHGFPLPVIDWFYAASMLRAHGIAVLDDAQLLQVRLGLFDFLNKDPRWVRTRRHPKWVAFQRRESGALGEDWAQQPFLGIPLRKRYEGLVPTSARPIVIAVGRRLRLL